MAENKKIENEHYLYCRGRIYTPYTYAKPKLHEMGYFTNDLDAFVNFKDLELEYVYGELIDYNGDYEHRYRCDIEWIDFDMGSSYTEENYAFYIPENSIPVDKQGWYRTSAINISTYWADDNYITPRISIEELKSNLDGYKNTRRYNELLTTLNEIEKIIDLIQDSTVLDSNTQAKTATFLKSYRNVLKERFERLELEFMLELRRSGQRIK